MTDELLLRAKAILEAAFELDGEARDAFVDAACGDDGELRAEVLSLLASDAADIDLGMGSGPPTVALASALRSQLDRGGVARGDGDSDALPGMVGGYRVVRLVARGGMGAVYEARQDNPDRRVALKMLRPDLVTPGLLARFRREATILGRLQHAGIAQIHEAGTAMVGGVEQPFFAMEFVEGRALTAHVRDAGLDVPRSLALFAEVCDALEHAHGKGVVHRDLKPENILVTAEGRPKVLDFGVARSTEADVTLTTVETRVGQIIGTLAYMSPEQVGGDPGRVDARSDVYALGVILYELLAGERPHDLARRSMTDAARVIQEEEATRLGSVDTAYRGDLETIVGKALEKEPGRRYQNAGALAADVRAHLRDEPIAARPPSRVYLARKFTRRHTGLVVGTAVGFAALSVALVLAVLSSLDQAAQRRASERVTYLTVLELAQSALDDLEPLMAGSRLERAPAELRGWEWEHLRARRDDALWTRALDVPAPVGFAANGKPRLALPNSAQELLFIGDGEHLLSFLDGQTLGLWEARSGRLLRRLPVGAELHPHCLALRDEVAALASRDDRLLLVDLGTGALVLDLPVPGRITALDWHPDGERLGVALGWAPADAGSLPVHQLLAGPPDALEVLREDIGVCTSLDWLGDGSRLVSTIRSGVPAADSQRYAELLDATGRVLVPKLTGGPSGTASVAVDAASGRIVRGSISRDLVVHDGLAPADRVVASAATLRGHIEPVVQHVAVAAGGTRAASVTGATLRTWDVERGETLGVRPLPPGTQGSCALSPDGSLVAVCRPGTLAVWDTRAQGSVLLGTHESYVYWLGTSPDGRLAYSYDFANTLRVWDPLTADTWLRLRSDASDVPEAHHMLGVEPAWSSDGCRLLERRGHRFRELDVVAGRSWRQVEGQTATRGLETGFARTLADVFAATRSQWESFADGSPSTPRLVHSPDGTRRANLLLGQLQDVGSATVLATLEGWEGRRLELHDAINATASFSPDGRRLAVAQDRVTLHDGLDGRVVARLEGGHIRRVYAVAWSPDGTRLATGGEDGRVVLWDAETLEPLLGLSGHEQYVHAVAWTRDGSALLSASGDGSVRRWDSVARAERVAAARAHDERVAQQRSRVAELFTLHDDPQVVADLVRADASLDDDTRHAALLAVRRLADAWWDTREEAAEPGAGTPEASAAGSSSEQPAQDGR